MSQKIATVIGSTGMIGTFLLKMLLKDDYFDIVRVIVRRPQPKTDPKLEVKLVDFNDAESLHLALEGTDTIFCCVGTTQRNVKGDHALYRKIDLDIPVNAARLGKETGCEKFIIVTAVGANSHSSTFYLKLKGEVENAIHAIGLASVHIMQPSMLLGQRKEKRPAEKIFQGLTKVTAGLFVGSLRKYRAIHGKTVARAMLNAAKTHETGFFRHTYDGMIRLAGESN